MSADFVTIDGRFHDPQGRYEEIKEKLINNFTKLDLEPEELDFMEEIHKAWDEFFRITDNYLELSIFNCYGRVGSILEVIDDEFKKLYSDVLIELFYTVNYPDYRNCEKLIYDGEEYQEFNLDIYLEEFYNREFEEDLDDDEIFELYINEFDKQIDFKLIV